MKLDVRFGVPPTNPISNVVAFASTASNGRKIVNTGMTILARNAEKKYFLSSTGLVDSFTFFDLLNYIQI
jgi:hypothetical protein